MRFRALSLVALLSIVCLTISCGLGSKLSSITIPSEGAITYSTLTWLHTDGKYIKNEDNQTVFLRGAAFGGLDVYTYWQGGYESLQYRMERYLLLSKGKATVIRCPITPFPRDTSDPATRWPNPPGPTTDENVDWLVDLAGQNNIYVVIEFHGGLSISECTRLVDDPTDFINWWMHWINRYKNNPVVCGFELYNEPNAYHFGPETQPIEERKQRYRDFITQVCEALSAVNPNALLLVSSADPLWNWVDDYWFTNQIPGNIVYTWDFYYKNWDGTTKGLYESGDYEAAKAKLEEKMYNIFGRAQEEYNLACLASEFGWYMNNETEPGWQVQMPHFHEYMNKMESNWYQWWWHNNPINLGLCNSDWLSLSPTGEVWEMYL